MKFRYEYLILVIIAFAAFSTEGRAQSAGSPLIYEVKFVKGVYAKTGSVQSYHPCPVNGPTECGNGNSTRLIIKATKGERVRFKLTSETGSAVFSIAAEDDGNPFKGATSVTSWTGTFPAGGDFRIMVYTSKSFTRYKLTVTRL